MKTRDHGLSEKEMELVKLIMAECEGNGACEAHHGGVRKHRRYSG